MPYEGVDFRGSDIGFELMDDAESCQRNCTLDANCQFYTYVNDEFFNPVYRYIFYTCMQNYCAFQGAHRGCLKFLNELHSVVALLYKFIANAVLRHALVVVF